MSAIDTNDEPPPRQAPTLNWARSVRRNLWIVPFVLPAGLMLALGVFYPLWTLFRMSVSDVTIYNINASWDYVGADNFSQVLQSTKFHSILIQSAIYVAIVLSVGLAGGVAASLLLNDRGWFPRFIAAFLLFMWSMPHVVLGSVWKFLFQGNGAVNSVLMAVEIISEPIYWLVGSNTALPAVAFTNAWAAIPFVALILRAALLDINKELLDAAAIDGATKLQSIRYVSLPLIRPALLIIGLLMIINAFRSFDYIYVMTSGGPGTSTSTLPFYSYVLSFATFDFGAGAAVAIIALVIVSPVAYLYIRAVLRERQSGRRIWRLRRVG